MSNRAAKIKKAGSGLRPVRHLDEFDRKTGKVTRHVPLP